LSRCRFIRRAKRYKENTEKNWRTRRKKINGCSTVQALLSFLRVLRGLVFCFPSVIARRHLLQGHRLDLRRLPSAAERGEARLADVPRRGGRGLERLAWIELASIVGQTLAHGAGHRQADVGVDVDLAHAAANATLDFLDRHAIGFLDVAAVLANDREPFLRHR